MARNRKKQDEEEGVKLICRNKRAFHEYTIGDRLECGIVLTGTEVKSLREGSGSYLSPVVAVPTNRDTR